MNLGAAANQPSDIDILIRIAAIIGPLIAVWLTAKYTRRFSRESFLRERIFAEVGQRREIVASFKKAYWAYRAEVVHFLEAVEKILATPPAEREKRGYKMDRIRDREDKVQETYARLESFVTVPVQVAAFGAMEAVTKAFNCAANGDVTQARALISSAAQHHEKFATSFNDEINDYNSIIYAIFTPIWRAILDRVRWKPLPFHVHPDVSTIGRRGKAVPLIDRDESGGSE
jgi:hypothetical protein